MIFYFSATGNSRYVAQRVAAMTREEVVSIAECIKKQRFRFVADGCPVGIVSPAYAWGLPSIVRDFLNELSLDGKPNFLWYAATYGSTPGQPGRFANKIMEEKGLVFDAYFGVKMPDTWTPIFDLSDKEKVDRINQDAEREIDFLVEGVESRATGDFMRRKVPALAAGSVRENALSPPSRFAIQSLFG